MQDKYTIEITTPKNPLKCHNLLTDVKKGKTELTPEFAREFLQSTNNRKNIADFLELLNKRFEIAPQEYTQYKPYIMAMVCNREQPDSINQVIAETAQKYINLKKADKVDRDFMAILSHVNLPEQQAKQVQDLCAKLYKVIPVDVSDIAEDVTKKIITENKSYLEISQFVMRELPETSKKTNILNHLYHKITGR